MQQKPRTFASWVLVLSVIGYAPVGLIGSLAGVGVSPPFRAAVVLLAVCVLFAKIRAVPLALALFFGFYGLRLLIDISEYSPGDPLIASVFYVGTVLLPAFALCMVRPGEIDWTATGWRLVLLGAFTCVGSLAGFLFGMDMTSHETARLEAERLNTIALGHVAATTSIAALLLLSDASKFKRVVLAAVIGAAMWTLLLTAARGPLVALAACLLAYTVLTRRIVLPLLLLCGVAYVFADEESILRIRFETLLDSSIELDVAASERLEFQFRAWEQFLERPIFGSGMAEQISGMYPHNLFVETLMAMGFVGAVTLAFVLWRATRGGWALAQKRELLAPLLLLQYFMGAQFSGAIWGSSALWVLVAIVSVYAVQQRKARSQVMAPRPVLQRMQR